MLESNLLLCFRNITPVLKNHNLNSYEDFEDTVVELIWIYCFS